MKKNMGRGKKRTLFNDGWQKRYKYFLFYLDAMGKANSRVYDTVYSKQILDPKVIEEKVLSDTGFVVQISTD